MDNSLTGRGLFPVICTECDTPFKGLRRNAKYCSTKCRYEAARRTYTITPLSKQHNISTTTLGAVNELRVSTDLMLKGYHIFRALSPACPCDIIAMKDGICLMVEVKTGFNNGRNGKNYMSPLHDGNIFDVLAVIFTDGTIIYKPELT